MSMSQEEIPSIYSSATLIIFPLNFVFDLISFFFVSEPLESISIFVNTVLLEFVFLLYSDSPSHQF